MARPAAVAAASQKRPDQPSPRQIRERIYGFGSMGLPSPLNLETAYELVGLVRAGAQRADIAEHFGVDRRTVTRWKTRLGFNWTRPTPDDRGALPRLWQTERTISEISEQLGVSSMTIRRWARELGLKRRSRRASPSRTERVEQRRREVAALVRGGHSDGQIAERLGVSARTVAIHRRAAGWFYASPMPIDDARLQDLFQSGLSDTEIAAEMGLKPGRVQVTRSRLRLLRS